MDSGPNNSRGIVGTHQISRLVTLEDNRCPPLYAGKTPIRLSDNGS
jgi:hypothetical protein